jgi:hypothetical protein
LVGLENLHFNELPDADTAGLAILEKHWIIRQMLIRHVLNLFSLPDFYDEEMEVKTD